MRSVERLRLMSKVARLYYEHDLRQPEIARHLALSQAMVSRLLAAAQREGIVRTTVMAPAGVYPELEEELARRYDLKDAVVADCASDVRDQVLRDIGSAAASYLETTLRGDEVVGISSWSETLLRTVSSMQPLRREGGGHVVQILGGIGKPTAEAHATRLTEQLASLLKAEPHFLLAPGVTASPEAAAAYLAEPHVQQVEPLFANLSVALVGIGALHPSRLLDESGNVFSEDELGTLERLGAVGDVCLRFFDDHGGSVASPFDERVIGLSLDGLRRVPRSVGVAGTAEKVDAIRGALEGRLVNVLVTDRFTAERLVTESPPDAHVPVEPMEEVPS
jgi:DNA-binding transcriptional regulator LsrR (DeoR family)